MLNSENLYGRIWIYAILIVTVVILRWVFIRIYKNRKQISGNDNFIVGINTISLLVFFFLLFFLFLQLFHVDIKQFFTSISIIAAAIAIISKDYISNAINGMILMFNSHISIGDYVRIGEQRGRVNNLSLINVHLVNEEGDLVLIPNNVVFSTQIVNYTKGETRKAQLELPLPPAMVEDLSKTELLFKEAISDFKHKANINSLSIRILEINKEFVNIKLSVLLHEADLEVEKEIRRRWLNKWATIKKQLK